MNSVKKLDILIPTFERPQALSVTLASLCSQSYNDFRVIVSDQTEDRSLFELTEIKTLLRILDSRGNPCLCRRHLPRKGMAEQRHFLLSNVLAPFCLFLDDDIYLEPDMLERLMRAMKEQRCGFVGAAPIGLSYLSDIRKDQQAIEFWEGRVEPEILLPNGPLWNRHSLHNAANLYHVQKQMRLTPKNERLYKVAWVGGCVLYDSEKLRKSGGFRFWKDLPVSHCGEDVFQEIKVMALYGGCGIIPSGAFHLEFDTTLPDRRINIPEILSREIPF